MSEYDRGVNDMWNVLIQSPQVLREAFGVPANENDVLHWIADNYAPHEAVTVMKTYKERTEFEVGDVVEIAIGDLDPPLGHRGIVSFVDRKNKMLEVFYKDHCVYRHMESCRKTGKHVDLQSILDMIWETGKHADLQSILNELWKTCSNKYYAL